MMTYRIIGNRHIVPVALAQALMNSEAKDDTLLLLLPSCCLLESVADSCQRLLLL